MEVQLHEGREDLEVVGEASYQDNLWRIVGGTSSPNERVRVEVSAVLVAETDNPYDANAVSVWVKGLRVGYLSREDARRYRPGLLALEQKHGQPIALAGAIVGGGMRADGPGRLGVFLDHDPADFGLRAMSPPRSSGSAMWTGLSDALAVRAGRRHERALTVGSANPSLPLVPAEYPGVPVVRTQRGPFAFRSIRHGDLRRSGPCHQGPDRPDTKADLCRRPNFVGGAFGPLGV
jgi:hypothetical protein